MFLILRRSRQGEVSKLFAVGSIGRFPGCSESADIRRAGGMAQLVKSLLRGQDDLSSVPSTTWKPGMAQGCGSSAEWGRDRGVQRSQPSQSELWVQREILSTNVRWHRLLISALGGS